MIKLLLFLIFFTLQLQAYNTTTTEQTFSRIYNTKVFGKSIAIGNTVLCPKSGGECYDATVKNDDLNLEETNSTATLSIPYSSYKVLKAYLFWQGRAEEDTTSALALANFLDANASTIDLTLPNATAATTISLDTNDTLNKLPDVLSSKYYNTYGTYTDITDEINTTSAEGNYTISNLYTHTGNSGDDMGYFGAWSIVFVVEDLTQTESTIQDISIYSGYQKVSSGDDETVDISGFLTPIDTTKDVNAELTVFAGEGDLYRSGDKLLIKGGSASNDDTDYTPIAYTSAKQTNAFASNISGDFNRSPELTNNNAIDLHTIDVGENGSSGDGNYNIIGHSVTEASIRFTSSEDYYFPSMLVFSVELYEPSFCYDYAYKQGNTYFTEENNGSIDPSLVGTVSTEDPVQMSFYIRNTNTSDVNAEDVNFTLSDFNTSQATILTGSFTQTSPGDLNFDTVTPTTSSTTGFTTELADSISANQGVFLKFTLDPILVSDLNMSLDASIDYTITVDGATIPYVDKKLNENVPLCGGGGEESYVPEWGPLNVLDSGQNKAKLPAGVGLTYNLYTQVAKRPYEVELVSFDPANLNQVKAITNYVGVELINAGGWQDVASACNDIDATISEDVVWIPFRGNYPDTNITNMTFNKTAIELAITEHRTKLTNANDFYGKIYQNATFRLWYMANVDNNDTPFEYTYTSDGNITVDFFPNIGGDSCGASEVIPYEWRADGSVWHASSQANTVCGNAGNSGVNPSQFAACMECLKGKYAKPICARDNFSVRPESFEVKLSDIDHTETDPAVQAATRVDLPSTANLAAGYAYRFDINATSHTSNQATDGASIKFWKKYVSDRNISFAWNPTSAGLDCYDTNSAIIETTMIDGIIDNYQKPVNNVGEYHLSVIDTGFTSVDQSPAHHTGSYFASGHDCALNDSSVPPISESANGTSMGCNVSSQHTNEDNSTFSTTDYNITFKPYRFDMSTFSATFGKTFALMISDPLLYMNDLNKSTAMAIHYSGTLRAVGKDDTVLTNFTDGCYAQPLDMQLDHNASLATVSVPQFQSAYTDDNSSHSTGVVNVTTSLVQSLPTSYFTKANLGVIPNMELHFNYERSASDPKEPQMLHLGDLNSSCTTLANCQSRAHLLPTYDPYGSIVRDKNITLDSNVTFNYGRVNAPRYRIDGFTGNVTIYYESYCQTSNCAAFGLTQESVNDVFWYVSANHLWETIQGDAYRNTMTDSTGNNQVVFSSPIPSFASGVKKITTVFQNNPAVGFPFKTKVIMTPDPWLVYDKYNADSNRSSFVIEFFNSTPAWSGTVNNSGTVDSNASKTTNRRINW